MIFRVLLLLVAVFALSTEPVQAGDYVYRDGYYWYGSTPYYRQLYTSAGYWYGGCYYPGKSYYQYTQATDYVPPVAKTVTYKDPGWRSKLLDIAAQRDKFEGKIRKEAFDQAYFLDSVKALGLQSNFTWNGYGTIPPGVASSYGSYGVSPYSTYQGNVQFGANAGTQYGYSYNSIGKLYGDTDVMSLYQMANQQVQNAQRLAGDGQAGFSSLISTEGGSRARVAEILAKGQIATRIIQSLSSGPEVKGFAFKFSSGGKVERVADGAVDPGVQKDLSTQFSKLATDRCAGCHSGGKAKGGFDISVYPTLTDEKKQAVWSRLITPDDKAVMPQPNTGETLKRLTPAELRLFFLN